MNEALELAIYRTVFSTFPHHCRIRRGESIEELSERKLGWNDARRSMFVRYQDFKNLLRAYSSEDQKFLINLLNTYQILMDYREDGTVEFEADCSDFFCWGSSDYEIFESYDIPAMREAYTRDRNLLLWVAKRRNMQPQQAVKQLMIDNGSWTSEWEALPENPIEVYLREEAAKEVKDAIL